MKLYRVFALLSLAVTMAGALLSTSRLATAATNANCPAIPNWYAKPQPACSRTIWSGPIGWCSGSYQGGGCCIYQKYKSYCVSSDPLTNGKLIAITHLNIAYSPGTSCHTNSDGSGDCVIPTEIAP
jgi:hypothetical protein